MGSGLLLDPATTSLVAIGRRQTCPVKPCVIATCATGVSWKATSVTRISRVSWRPLTVEDVILKK